jgi:serine/threonine protein kinase
MCVVGRRCGAWISLVCLGVSLEGCLRSPEWLRSVHLPCHQSLINPSNYIELPHESLTCIKTVSHGAFGYIDWGKYKKGNDEHYVYIKRPILPGKSLLHEACVQHVVSERLAEIGFLRGAPRVLRLVSFRDRSVGFVMEPIDGAVTLDRYLDSIPVSSLSNAIIDCLLQLCGMIWYIEQQVGINHRDLTPNNFLVVEHPSQTKIINIENEIIDLTSTRSLTLIDFGFSCLGSIETHQSQLSLSTVYPTTDPCPKEGRDLFLFLGLLYIEYYTRLPPQLLTLFESWLQEPGSNLCKFMRKDKESSKKWLYFMAGNDHIKRFHTCPIRIVTDLQAFLV